MFKKIFSISSLFALGFTAQAQLTLLDPGLDGTSPVGASITDSQFGQWVRVGSNRWSNVGADNGTKQYVSGEMGRLAGQQNDPLWFGQVVDSASAFTGSINLEFDASHRLSQNETVRVEVYGLTGTYSNFLLDNDTQAAGWTLLNPGQVTVTYTADPGITDLASYEVASRTVTESIVAVDLGTGFDFVGVRFRTQGLGNNTVTKELAFTNVQFAAIPEPATVASFVGAVVLLFAVRRRRLRSPQV